MRSDLWKHLMLLSLLFFIGSCGGQGGSTGNDAPNAALHIRVVPENAGAVSISPQKDDYQPGDIITLTPVPASGHRFNGWGGKDAALVSANQIVFNTDKDIIAHFKQLETSVQSADNVLFVGNSLTGWAGGVHHHLAGLTTASGKGPVHIADEIYGGSTFEQHWKRTDTTTEIATGGYDIIILQGSSYEPVYSTDNFHLYGGKLAELSFSGKAAPVFYMTWCLRDQDPDNAVEGSGVYKTQYDLCAANNQTDAVPVGMAFDYVRRNHPAINLFYDGTHQNLNGAYLAACCFYKYLTGASPEGIDYLPTWDSGTKIESMDAVTAGILQTVADLVTTVTLTAKPVETPSAAVNIILPEKLIFNEGDAIDFQAVATDLNQGHISASIGWKSTLAEDLLQNGATFSTRTLSAGTRTITASATGADGVTVGDSISLTVIAATAKAPIAVDDSAVALYESMVQINVAGNDSDDGQLDLSSITIEEQPAHGSITAIHNAMGTVDYTAAEGYSGPDSFTYTIADNEGLRSNIARVNVTVLEQGGQPLVLIQGYDHYDPNDDPALPATLGVGQTYTNPHYKTTLKRMTDPAVHYPGATFMVNEYSRKQAYNVDSTRFLALSSDGFWHLYSNDGTYLKRLDGPAADCEITWHPTDPDIIIYTGLNGGLVFQRQHVITGETSVHFDLTAVEGINGYPGATSIKEIWPAAQRAWTKAEGSCSSDGRYWGFQVETDSFDFLGLITYDLVANQITGVLDKANYGARPDHVSMSPSGDYIVPSSDSAEGTRAYTRDFSSHIQLHHKSEHSDIGRMPDGNDVYVAADYQANAGTFFMVVLQTNIKTVLNHLYIYGNGGPYPIAAAYHISGRAFGKPGWMLLSTYAPTNDTWAQNKILAIELKENGKILNISNTYSKAGGYWAEPKAVVNHDFTRILYTSTWFTGQDNDACAYEIQLPAGVIK